jgi:hypothetical protein
LALAALPLRISSMNRDCELRLRIATQNCDSELPSRMDFAMTLPMMRNGLFFFRASRLRGVGLAIALLLSGCGALPWPPQAEIQKPTRRRAVAPSQRREARMARPLPAQGDRPAVDYAPYKAILPGMALAEVEALLGGSPGQGFGIEEQELVGLTAQGEAPHGWRWTHPSGVYNIHLELKGNGEQPSEWVVQAKWLTYNPPQ